MRVPASLEQLPVLLAHVREAARQAGLSARALTGLELAVEEVSVNIINHAYRAAGGPIEVTCQAAADGACEVTIRDQGPPFDPLARPAPDTAAAVDERPIGGLGVHLVRHQVDGIEYRRDGEANVLVLRQGRAGPSAVGPEQP